MISLRPLLKWQAKLIFPNGTEAFSTFVATTTEKAYEAAQEIYPECVIKILGVEPEWDDAA